ncbi:RagB/SusD family nutrient uptake outer membrane protein [Flagellimonas baculiformis]|uniref:RagB/SusD family nutrient uptake outer membrane protein n=1 Tax=Flagellimonas baculiformis TaxID=3067310 RepID=UPI00296FDC1D|nr:RagB/SusD family nutrient uptake outer membrane protein [Muricauda sp. D6]
MKTNKIFVYLSFIALLIGCDDFDSNLDVANPENPNDDILATDPIALESTAGTLINNWFQASHSTESPAFAMATMADVLTCSWGNFGMRDTSSEPRVAFNNESSYGNAALNENFFNSMYSILSDSNTIMLAVNNDIEFENPEAVAAIAKFAQAIVIGTLAMTYDKVWLSDENGVVNEGVPVDYMEAMNFAIGKLDEAIALSSGSSFTLPESWVPGMTISNSYLTSLMNSFGARMLTMNSRNSTERDATNWTKVLEYANNGITSDFEPLADDVVWYDLYKTYAVYPGWGRVDLYVINLMDPSTPSYWPANATVLPESTSDDARLTTDFEYLSSQDFNAARGTYHYSSYRYSRYDDYITLWTTPMPEFVVSENDMYKAEALLRLGQYDEAADVINAGTRTTRGGLPDIGTSPEEIADAIHYERLVEFPFTGYGLNFFEMRKENLLQEGTMLHFPVPGTALAAIPAEYYTFGGTTGVAGQDYSTGGWR